MPSRSQTREWLLETCLGRDGAWVSWDQRAWKKRRPKPATLVEALRDMGFWCSMHPLSGVGSFRVRNIRTDVCVYDQVYYVET